MGPCGGQILLGTSRERLARRGGSPDSADVWGTLTSQNLFLYVSLHENQITEGDRSVQRSLVFILLVYIRSLVFKVASHLLFHFPL